MTTIANIYQVQFLSNFASYNCDAYGAGNFNDGQVCAANTTTTTTTPPPASAASGGLANTGTMVIYSGIAGLLLIAVALAIVFSRRKAREKAEPTC